MIPVKTAICSYGMSGLVFHGPLLAANPHFEITKILERKKQASKEKHPSASIVRYYDDILDDPGIELVVVNTPDQYHFHMALQAIENGKHVVVEKPFTLRTSDADELIHNARKKGVLLTVFQNRRWDGDFLTVQSLIKEKKLGRLVEFESHFDRYRNFLQDSWKDQRSSGSGTLYNLGSHLIDQALVLFGVPDRIFCDVRKLRTGAEVDDSFDLFMLYPEIKCLLRASYLVREPGPRFILHGTDGSFLKWHLDPQEELLKNGVVPDHDGWAREEPSKRGILHTEANGKAIRTLQETVPGDYRVFYDNLYEAIRNGEQLLVRPEESRNVIRIIEAAYKSGRNGEGVSIRD